jgi:hypothetical protein
VVIVPAVVHYLRMLKWDRDTETNASVPVTD